jgi:hypothetical protein
VALEDVLKAILTRTLAQNGRRELATRLSHRFRLFIELLVLQPHLNQQESSFLFGLHHSYSARGLIRQQKPDMLMTQRKITSEEHKLKQIPIVESITVFFSGWKLPTKALKCVLIFLFFSFIIICSRILAETRFVYFGPYQNLLGMCISEYKGGN